MTISPAPLELSGLSLKDKQEILKLHDAKARLHLIDFIKATKPDYRVGWFNRILAREMELFLEAVVSEKSPRLIIMAPPRHGKSEVVSRRFPAYAFGRHPDLSFIATSYGSDLASRMNRDVQRIIDSPEYHRIFPETRLWGSNIRTEAYGSYLRNSDIFEIVDHKGVYKSAGVGAGITGGGGHILMVDDPVKDAEEAASETIRKSIWEWWTSTFYTRCEPGGGIVIIMTRWHEEDPVGKLLANMKAGGEKWKVVRFPAVAEHDEFDEDGTLLRREDEPLHPRRYDRAALERIKIGTGDPENPGVGSKVWASLYQQNPSAAEGNKFKRENWKFLKPPEPLAEMEPRARREWLAAIGVYQVIQAWDTALGGKKTNDYTACATLGIARDRYYILNIWKGRLQFPEALKQVELLYEAWTPARVIVEGGGSASGKATVQTLGRSTTIPFTEHNTVTDKEFRADMITPTHESKLITIIEGGAWQVNFLDQCANFPAIKNDDDVDAFMLAMEYAIGGGKRLNITPELLARLG